MKNGVKNAFTFAEVIIALTVVGAIACATIPMLKFSTDNGSSKTQWKTVFNDLTWATQAIMNDNGGTMIGCYRPGTQIKDEYAKYLNYSKICYAVDGCWHGNDEWSDLKGESLGALDTGRGLILSNGAMVQFESLSTTCTNDTLMTGGHECAQAFVDVNGYKGPNTIGRDIFGFIVFPNGIKPFGVDDYYSEYSNCTSAPHDNDPKGWACSAPYLQQ